MQGYRVGLEYTSIQECRARHGESAAEAFAKMNLVLLADSVRTAPCDGFTHEDLNGAARVLYALRNAELDRGFQSRADRHGRI